MKRMILAGVVLVLALSAGKTFAECKEYKIVDFGDRVEAVCIGDSLPEPRGKEAVKQNKEDSTPNPDIGSVVIKSYDIQHIPSDKPPRDGQSFPGQYSITMDVTNQGRKGTVFFSLKQISDTGVVTENLSCLESFEQDQDKTVRKMLPASRVPVNESFDWKIEATKK